MAGHAPTHIVMLPRERDAGDADAWALLPPLDDLWGRRVSVTVELVPEFESPSAMYRARMRATARRLQIRAAEADEADPKIAKLLRGVADAMLQHYAEAPEEASP